ncbi:hypothetical protein Thiowin_02297 [Thiorhodovibrio winogradskyi]|uniref:Uncharacterized protein n=1 Tax=Thiorhodovibrio winogradskyi TaxID=77007 RepID=A0ABZ0SAI4_9GAMM|nr:hypothetical protein [Thiorhodovibrio winogradskyi]
MRVTATLFCLFALAAGNPSCATAAEQRGKNDMLLEPTRDGYRLCVNTRYKFNDRVAFDSEFNGTGSGVIVTLDIALDGGISYTIELPDKTWQPGILEGEMTLLESAP